MRKKEVTIKKVRSKFRILTFCICKVFGLWIQFVEENLMKTRYPFFIMKKPQNGS